MCVSSPNILLPLCILPTPQESGEGNVQRHMHSAGKSTLLLRAQQGITLSGMEPGVLTHSHSGYFPFDLCLRQHV